MTTGIYKLTFTEGGVYIGQAVDIEKRYEEHKKQLIAGTHTRKLQAAYINSNYSLPNLELLVDCHRDFLDIFESFLINAQSRSLSLNTTIPVNLLNGASQRTLNILMENRHQSLVNLVDTIDTHIGKLEGLKLSLDEAEFEIERLERTRTKQELETEVGKKYKELKKAYQELALLEDHTTEKYKALLESNYRLQVKYTKMMKRSWWERLLNIGH